MGAGEDKTGEWQSGLSRSRRWIGPGNGSVRLWKKKKQLGMGEMHDIGICFTCMELFRMNPVQQFRTN